MADATLSGASPSVPGPGSPSRTLPGAAGLRAAAAVFRRGGALHRPTSFLAWGAVLLIVLMAILAPLIASADPTVRTQGQELAAPFSAGHLLGTDELGRDQFSRVVYGARPIVVVPAVAVLLAGIVGTLIGLVAGFFGRWIQTVLMRLSDVVQSFPPILMAIMIVAGLGASNRNLVVAIAVTMVPAFARIGNALTQREATKEYTLAARASGFSTPRIIFREVLPNVVGQIVVQATALVASAAGFATALSYLGLGVQPPAPDWGGMMRDSQELLSVAPDLCLIPAALITIFVLAVNFIGDDLHGLLGRDRGGV